MIRYTIRPFALAGLGVLILAGCGVSSASTDFADSSDGGSGSSKNVDLAELSGQLRADPPDDVEVPASNDGLPPVIRSIKTKDRVVFITIDDGGTADPKVTEIIKQAGIPVTGFQTENVTARDKAYFKEISDITGQRIQNHTISHPQMTGLSLSGQKQQICQVSEHYTNWFGARPWMLRPPYGEFNDQTREAARACGIDYIVNWTVSLPQAHLRYALGDSLKPGDIILTHWRPDLRKHLPLALSDIARQGFKVAALQDYLPDRTD